MACGELTLGPIEKVVNAYIGRLFTAPSRETWIEVVCHRTSACLSPSTPEFVLPGPASHPRAVPKGVSIRRRIVYLL